MARAIQNLFCRSSSQPATCPVVQMERNHPATATSICARDGAGTTPRLSSVRPGPKRRLFCGGLFVARRPGRIHAVRCSYAADLYNTIDRNPSAFETVRGYLERLTMRRADVCYSPSRYLADYFRRVHNIDVRVIRPPAHSKPAGARTPAIVLPSRFFIHFGMLIDRKGTDLLAEALPLAWQMAPDLTMVWSGRYLDQVRWQRFHSLWGDRAPQILITGPLFRPNLYDIRKRRTPPCCRLKLTTFQTL